MNSTDCIKLMTTLAGKSLRQVSEEMGRAPTFLSTTFYKGSTTRVDTFADIANVTGCKVIVKLRDGTEIEVTE